MCALCYNPHLMVIRLSDIQEAQQQLALHSLLNGAIQTPSDLKLFMQYHVFAVWDFMSLLKTLQHHVVPSGYRWMPIAPQRASVARMINEIVLCEESDLSPNGDTSMSHFDLYVLAMNEIGANTQPILGYLNRIQETNQITGAPNIVQPFISTTFRAIEMGPHCAAASFCYGRETMLPIVFKQILIQLELSPIQAPTFHYYLDRHIQVDGDDHGPMAESLVLHFCQQDDQKRQEAHQAAMDAIQARSNLFDGILAELNP